MAHTCFNCPATDNLFGAPESIEMREKWLEVMPEEIAAVLDDSFRICAEHFDHKHILGNGLAPRAIPTKFQIHNVWCEIEDDEDNGADEAEYLDDELNTSLEDTGLEDTDACTLQESLQSLEEDPLNISSKSFEEPSDKSSIDPFGDLSPVKPQSIEKQQSQFIVKPITTPPAAASKSIAPNISPSSTVRIVAKSAVVPASSVAKSSVTSPIATTGSMSSATRTLITSPSTPVQAAPILITKSSPSIVIARSSPVAVVGKAVSSVVTSASTSSTNVVAKTTPIVATKITTPLSSKAVSSPALASGRPNTSIAATASAKLNVDQNIANVKLSLLRPLQKIHGPPKTVATSAALQVSKTPSSSTVSTTTSAKTAATNVRASTTTIASKDTVHSTPVSSAQKSTTTAVKEVVSPPTSTTKTTPAAKRMPLSESKVTKPSSSSTTPTTAADSAKSATKPSGILGKGVMKIVMEPSSAAETISEEKKQLDEELIMEITMPTEFHAQSRVMPENRANILSKKVQSTQRIPPPLTAFSKTAQVHKANIKPPPTTEHIKQPRKQQLVPQPPTPLPKSTPIDATCPKRVRRKQFKFLNAAAAAAQDGSGRKSGRKIKKKDTSEFVTVFGKARKTKSSETEPGDEKKSATIETRPVVLLRRLVIPTDGLIWKISELQRLNDMLRNVEEEPPTPNVAKPVASTRKRKATIISSDFGNANVSDFTESLLEPQIDIRVDDSRCLPPDHEDVEAALAEMHNVRQSVPANNSLPPVKVEEPPRKLSRRFNAPLPQPPKPVQPAKPAVHPAGHLAVVNIGQSAFNNNVKKYTIAPARPVGNFARKSVPVRPQSNVTVFAAAHQITQAPMNTNSPEGRFRIQLDSLKGDLRKAISVEKELVASYKKLDERCTKLRNFLDELADHGLIMKRI